MVLEKSFMAGFFCGEESTIVNQILEESAEANVLWLNTLLEKVFNNYPLM